MIFHIHPGLRLRPPSSSSSAYQQPPTLPHRHSRVGPCALFSALFQPGPPPPPGPPPVHNPPSPQDVDRPGLALCSITVLRHRHPFVNARPTWTSPTSSCRLSVIGHCICHPLPLFARRLCHNLFAPSRHPSAPHALHCRAGHFTRQSSSAASPFLVGVVRPSTSTHRRRRVGRFYISLSLALQYPPAGVVAHSRSLYLTGVDVVQGRFPVPSCYGLWLTPVCL